MYFNSTHAHLQQNFLYLYSFVYSLPDDGLVKAETCKREIINDKWLLTIDYAICCIKYNMLIRLV